MSARLLLLRSLSWDLCFKLCHIKHFALLDPKLAGDLVETMLPAADSGCVGLHLTTLIDTCCKSSGEQKIEVKAKMRSLLFFNGEHADGHYRLNLAIKLQREVAHRCVVVSSWMRARSLAAGRRDLSHLGNHDCLRHTWHAGYRFAFNSAEWQVPGFETFEFDFVLPRPELKRADAIDSLTCAALLAVLLRSPCRPLHRILALQQCAHLITLLPEHLAKILRTFPRRTVRNNERRRYGLSEEYRPRTEVYVLFYNRTLYHAEVVSPLLLYNPHLLRSSDTREICDRLGAIHTFDLMNIHDKRSNLGNRHGPLDMGTWDGYLIVKLMMLLSAKEHAAAGNERPNFDNSMWSEVAAMLARGGYTFVIPSSWETDLPKTGEFETTYICEDDCVFPEIRKQLCETWLMWSFRDALQQ